MSRHILPLQDSTRSQKVQKPMQSQHSTLRSKCIYMQRSKGLANCPYITNVKSNTSSKMPAQCISSNITEPGIDRLVRHDMVGSRPSLKSVQLETELNEDWECGGLEGGIRKVTKYSVVATGLSGRRTHDTENQVEETKSLCGVESTSVLDFGREGAERRKSAGSCKCKKDHFLPCCSRATRWVRLLFAKSGNQFYYRSCKSQYEVRV
eukprot:TRINITY_DN7017_c0_g1_i4.p1 TRINITY_DN7017_c0_g1~~TRINITY_DN7017_c0_g1_i4.p1  ORF type:complete len:208 (+),score=38.46 TRINITY_DN7017_c0_g1_i4:206-829(+)